VTDVFSRACPSCGWWQRRVTDDGRCAVCRASLDGRTNVSRPAMNTRSRGHAWRSWRAYLNGARAAAPVNRRLVVVRAAAGDVRLPGCVEAVLAEAVAGREGSDDR